jgi:photosystem II stability/assembly factor-like uncharacterized protein
MRPVFGVIACALIWPAGLAHATQWELVHTGAPEAAFVAVTAQPASPERLFAATHQGVYESTDRGVTWTERFRTPAGITISSVAVEGFDPPAILVATDQGLYGTFNGEWHWMRVFRQAGEGEARCTHVAFHPSSQHVALLGTSGGLFISSNQGREWTEVMLPPSAREVIHFAFSPDQPDRVLLATAAGVFVGRVMTGEWRQTVRVVGAEETEVEEPEMPENPEAAEENGVLHHLSAIATDPLAPSLAYLAGSRGVAESSDGGLTWQWLSTAGLPSRTVGGLLLKAHSPLVVYASTMRGIGRYDPGRERWEMLSSGLTATAVNELMATETHLWAATDQGLYRYSLSPDPFADGGEPPSPKELLANFVHEPTVTQVRESAIRYAEVHPDKIARWRRQASLKALLPSVDAGFDRDQSNNIHVDEGSFSCATTSSIR